MTHPEPIYQVATLAAAERSHVLYALICNQWKRAETAAALAVTPSTLTKLLKKHDLSEATDAPPAAPETAPETVHVDGPEPDWPGRVIAECPSCSAENEVRIDTLEPQRCTECGHLIPIEPKETPAHAETKSDPVPADA